MPMDLAFSRAWCAYGTWQRDNPDLAMGQNPGTLSHGRLINDMNVYSCLFQPDMEKSVLTYHDFPARTCYFLGGYTPFLDKNNMFFEIVQIVI